MTLKQARMMKGITQRDMAKRLNVNQAAISHWERGKTQPLKKYYAKIEAILGVKAGEIEEMKEERAHDKRGRRKASE